MRGVVVNPAAIREARLSAGMSLAQVAGTELTRAAVHQVETGKCRPSLRTLEVIARRLGKPASSFLAENGKVRGKGPERIRRVEGSLDVLERLAERGAHAEVVAMAEQLLSQAADACTEASLHFLIGRSHVHLNEAAAALEHLNEARGLFRALADRWMEVECLDWQATALWQQDDPTALSMAEQALVECRRLEPSPPEAEARILRHIGMMLVGRGELARARKAYEASIEAAGNTLNLGYMARTYEDLSGVYHALGQLSKALGYMHQARALYRMERNAFALARSEGNLGELLMRQGDLEAAERHMRSSLAQRESLMLERAGRSHVLWTLGELYLVRGDLEKARELLDEAEQTALEEAEGVPLAHSRRIRAHLELREGNFVAARASFESAIEQFHQLGMATYEHVCRSECAEFLEQQGERDAALEHWKNAAMLNRGALQGGLTVAFER
jgi:tetratricopeptide (TPR) repeat protein